MCLCSFCRKCSVVFILGRYVCIDLGLLLRWVILVISVMYWFWLLYLMFELKFVLMLLLVLRIGEISLLGWMLWLLY